MRISTGIGKQPAEGPVAIREPGPKRGGLGSGLVGDLIGNHRHHGGSDQAVYAYARERLEEWAAELGRDLPNGMFGENLTTSGLDVDAARLGELWRVGSTVVLRVTGPRIPCATFRARMGEPGWVKRFAAVGLTGAYLSVVTGGEITVGDPIEIVYRPDHDVTTALAFRAMIGQRSLWQQVALAGDDLSDELREMAAAGRTYRLR
ncbi:MAG: MOSC domain-containing protein [Jatrophihabitans sp.]|uniref:MOSC domain-containing protein n=1 Tax=Jatrophihabitans sp. TaxID=1932789 RepID=UPI00390EFF80